MQSFLLYLSINTYKKNLINETNANNFFVSLKLIGLIKCKKLVGELFENNESFFISESNRFQKFVIKKFSPEETESIAHFKALLMYSDEINILKCEHDNVKLNFSSIDNSSSSSKRIGKNINWSIISPYCIMLDALIQLCIGIGTLPRPVSDNFQRQKIFTIRSESKLSAINFGNESSSNAMIMFQLFNNDQEQAKYIVNIDNRKSIIEIFNLKCKSLPHLKELDKFEEYILYYNDKKTSKRPVGLIHGIIKQQNQPLVPVDLQNLLENFPIQNVINVEEAELSLCSAVNEGSFSFNNDRKYISQHSSLIKLKFLTGSAFVYNFRREFLFYLEKNSIIFIAGYVGFLKKSNDSFYAKPISGCQTIQYNGSCILFIGNHYLLLLDH